MAGHEAYLSQFQKCLDTCFGAKPKPAPARPYTGDGAAINAALDNDPEAASASDPDRACLMQLRLHLLDCERLIVAMPCLSAIRKASWLSHSGSTTKGETMNLKSIRGVRRLTLTANETRQLEAARVLCAELAAVLRDEHADACATDLKIIEAAYGHKPKPVKGAQEATS